MSEGLLGRTAVVIVSYNTVQALRTCLAALTSGAGNELEVVVVDNASTDGSLEMVRAEFPRVALMALERNHGFGAAVNAGAKGLAREFLLLLNPDCLVEPGSIELLAARLDAHPGVGFAGPKVLLPSGRADHASLMADPDLLGSMLYFSRLPRLFPRSRRLNRYSLRHLDYDHEHELLSGTAACLMVRTAAFSEVSGFDESFFMYGEDLDLCRRLREAGYRGVYEPNAVALHNKGEASRRQSRAMLVEFHRSMWTYYRKHEAGHRPRVVNELVRFGIQALAAVRLAANAVRREKRVSAR